MGIIITGCILILAGAYGIFTGYSQGKWGMAGVGWGALIIGTLSLLFGVGKRASDKVATPHKEVADHAQTELRALVQAMGAVALADNKIRNMEIETIVNVYDQMMGVHISHDEVREILSDLGPDFDIVGKLTASRGKISPSMKRTIVQCCQLVMVSDREVVVPEQNRVQQVGLALGFDPTEIEDMVASAGL